MRLCNMERVCLEQRSLSLSLSPSHTHVCMCARSQISELSALRVGTDHRQTMDPELFNFCINLSSSVC